MPPRLPHIVIFNPDQWRADCIAHHGNPAVLTPNLDAFAASEGVSFRNAYCQNPVCTPSRCSFMTGWYPHVQGHRTMFHMLHPERGQPNLLRYLKEQGYFIWWGGKNDLVPGQDGYSFYCDIRYQATEADRARWQLTRREDTHSGALLWRGQPGEDTYYSFFKGKLEKDSDPIYLDSDWEVVLGAIDFLHNYRGEQPLCLFLALSYPHPPYCVEEPYFSQVDRNKLPPRIPTPSNWQAKPSILEGIWLRQQLHTWSEERWNELRATYLGMCARVDDQFGRLCHALRQAGFYEDSAIFFFADHGDFTGDYGLVEKTQNTFEDCLTNVPFLIKPPHWLPVQPRISPALVELIDFSATVYDLVGVDPNYTHFGNSLLPLLAGQTDSHRDAVFCEGGRLYGEHQAMELESRQTDDPSGLYYPRLSLQAIDDHPYHTKAAMCRTERFKYVKRLYEPDELYDLQQDPYELINRITDPAFAPVVQQLRERLLTWYMATVDTVPMQPDRRW